MIHTAARYLMLLSPPPLVLQGGRVRVRGFFAFFSLRITDNVKLLDPRRLSTAKPRWHEGKREGKTNEISSRSTSRFRAIAVPFPAVVNKPRPVLHPLCGSARTLNQQVEVSYDARC